MSSHRVSLSNAKKGIPIQSDTCWPGARFSVLLPSGPIIHNIFVIKSLHYSAILSKALWKCGHSYSSIQWQIFHSILFKRNHINYEPSHESSTSGRWISIVFNVCWRNWFLFTQEMFGDFMSEMKNPNMLKPFDEIFEFQLPLRNAKLKFHSKVKQNLSMMRRIHCWYLTRLDLFLMCFIDVFCV